MTRSNVAILQSLRDYAKYLYDVLMWPLSDRSHHIPTTDKLHTRVYRLDKVCQCGCAIRLLCYLPSPTINTKYISLPCVYSVFSVLYIFNRVYNYLYEG